LDSTIQAVSFKRSPALNHRLFKVLGTESGAHSAQHNVFLQINFRWLSCRRVLTCVFEMRLAIMFFLREKINALCKRIAWVCYTIGFIYWYLFSSEWLEY